MLPRRKAFILGMLLLLIGKGAWAGSGTEGASFLDIPVGGRPAALGSAYSALATDGYAPTYNPGALGFIKLNELTAMHLAYVESVDYEYASFVHPLTASDAVGLSAQVLLPGSINGTDINGNSIGSISGHYGAYGLAYGHSFDERLGVGLTATLVNASIDDVSANAYAATLGGLYKLNDRVSLSAVAANVGSSLKLVNQADSLPAGYHFGAAFMPTENWTGTGEIVYESMGLFSGRFGVEWTPLQVISLRMGYRTDTVKELSTLAGFTTGLGIHLWGQELDYAWLPLGDLGNTQYISLVIRFGDKKGFGKVLKEMTRKTDDSDADGMNTFMQQTVGDDDLKDLRDMRMEK